MESQQSISLLNCSEGEGWNVTEHSSGLYRDSDASTTLFGTIPFHVHMAYKFHTAVFDLTVSQGTLKKTIVSVELRCSRCRQKVMKLVAQIEGITSIVLDPSKNTVTVIGDADPVRIIKKVRKFRRSASIVSIGPPKEEKKDDTSKKDAVPSASQMCKSCDVWYVVGDDLYSCCSIM